MKKHLYLILFVFIFFLTACNQQSIEKNGVEKGFGDILRIEISKFQYNGEKTIENQKVDNIHVIEKTEDLKNFLNIFNTRQQSYKMFEFAYNPNGKVTIFNQNGNKELYNIWISEKSCIIEDLQAEKRKQMPYYTIENNPKLIEIYNLIK